MADNYVAPDTSVVPPIPEDIKKLAGKAKKTDPIFNVSNWALNEDTCKAAIAYAKAKFQRLTATASARRCLTTSTMPTSSIA